MSDIRRAKTTFAKLLRRHMPETVAKRAGDGLLREFYRSAHRAAYFQSRADAALLLPDIPLRGFNDGLIEDGFVNFIPFLGPDQFNGEEFKDADNDFALVIERSKLFAQKRSAIEIAKRTHHSLYQEALMAQEPSAINRLRLHIISAARAGLEGDFRANALGLARAGLMKLIAIMHMDNASLHSYWDATSLVLMPCAAIIRSADPAQGSNEINPLDAFWPHIRHCYSEISVLPEVGKQILKEANRCAAHLAYALESSSRVYSERCRDINAQHILKQHETWLMSIFRGAVELSEISRELRVEDLLRPEFDCCANAAKKVLEECQKAFDEEVHGRAQGEVEEAPVVVVDTLTPVAADKDSGEFPEVEVYTKEALSNFADAITRTTSEVKTSLRAIKEKLSKMPNVRPLAAASAIIDSPEFEALERDFPNFSELFVSIKNTCLLGKAGLGEFYMPPTLLLGEPGIGKSEFVLRLSKFCGSDFDCMNMGAAQSASFLSGSDVFWGNSQPGRLFNLLAYGKNASPFVFLDELDKVTSGERYSPTGALYSLLERSSAAKFCDLGTPQLVMNAANVIWFGAANYEDCIDPVILSRFRVFRIPTPTPDQMRVIARSIYSAMLADRSWGKAFAPELPEAVLDVVATLSPREVRKSFEHACANAVANGRFSLVSEDIPVKPVEKNAFGFVS